MGHHYFTCIKFATEPPTLAMVGDQASLRGWQDCLFGIHSLYPTPPYIKNWRQGVWTQTLSKPSRTARNLCPSGYGVFTRQRDQSLCPHTPCFSLNLLGRGSKGPTCVISIKERLAGHPARSDGSGRCREMGIEKCDASCRLH